MKIIQSSTAEEGHFFLLCSKYNYFNYIFHASGKLYFIRYKLMCFILYFLNYNYYLLFLKILANGMYPFQSIYSSSSNVRRCSMESIKIYDQLRCMYYSVRGPIHPKHFKYYN